MDKGIERIRELCRQARQVTRDGPRELELEQEARAADRARLVQLERTSPERLRQLSAAADGLLTVEGSAFRSSTSTAISLEWLAGSRGSRAVELWLLRETGSVEWRWRMGYREAPIVHRVPASRFALARLDDLVVALADPRAWQGGNPPEI